MKKILILSSLAVVLTGCSTGEKKTKSVSELNLETSVQSQNSKTDKEVVVKEEKTTTEEKKKGTKDVFKEILANPNKYFDTEVTDIKYTIKKADTEYLLLSGKPTVEKGITQIKVFAYDKEKESVVDTKEFISTGVAGAGGFRGGLDEYEDSSNKFRYITISSGTGEYTIEDIVLANKGVKKENKIEGSLRNGEISKGNVKEIAWQVIGSDVKPNEETTTEKKEKTEEKKTDSKKEESSSNALSSEKSDALAKGMKAFGEKMNQVPYEKTDVPDKLTWQSGGDVDGYKIYESYIYKSGGTTHRYFFVTNSSGTPEVLYSTGGTSVKHTANADITAMFKGVYGGSESETNSISTKISSESATYRSKDNKTITRDKNGNINLYGHVFIPKSNESGVIGFADSSIPENVTNATVVSLVPAGVTSKYTEQVKGKDDVSRERIIIFTIGAGPDSTEIYFKEGESKQESKPSKSSKLDLDAIAKGDFTSMYGKHKNSQGQGEFVIENNSKLDGMEITKIVREGNVVKIQLPIAWFVVVPAGEPKPHVQGWTGEGFQNDDQSKDRAYIFGNGVDLIFFD